VRIENHGKTSRWESQRKAGEPFGVSLILFRVSG
jgi:hypothetical protein